MTALPAENDWLLTGIPRAGTSMCCRLAGQLPNVVALSEPLDGPALAQPGASAAAVGAIEAFVASARARIASEGRALTLNLAGRLADDVVGPVDRAGLAGDPGPRPRQRPRLRQAERLRLRQAERGDIRIDKPLSADFALLVKHNALFAALLPVLRPRFRMLAVVRNPIAVLASWQTVPLPVGRGRLPAGERFDAALRGRLDAEPNALRRQILILDWFFAQYRKYLPAAATLRYEDIVASSGAALFRRLGLAGEGEPLRDRHAAPPPAFAEAALAALQAGEGAWRHFYRPEEVQAAAFGTETPASGGGQ